MLRKSFLLYKDYKFLVPLVEIMYNSDFDNLLKFNPNKEKNRESVFELSNQICSYFEGKHYFKNT